MLSHVELRNFRAFKNLSLDFSRINVFVGPNNSGKSSIVSAINLIAQNLNDNPTGAPLVLRGKYDDLGTYIDVVNGNRAKTPLTIGFTAGSISIKIEFKYRTQRKEIEITKYLMIKDGSVFYEYSSNSKGFNIWYDGMPIEEIVDTSNKRRPRFDGFFVHDAVLRRASITFGTESGSILKKLDKNVYQRLRNVDSNMRRAYFFLRRQFSSFDTLSPFREPPKRTFLFSGTSPVNIGQCGENTIDMLVADHSKRASVRTGLVDGVSDWFARVGIGSKLVVKELTSRHFEVCVQGYDGKDHNICDVGFGCSQVMPVLVGGLQQASAGLSRFAPLFVVQEPEIHLHPNAQAELGSFFVDLCKMRKSSQFFFETHSDTFIIRLQRHVAEGDLPADAVKVFYVYDEAGEKIVRSLNLNDSGFLDDALPGGFFPQRQIESLAFAKAAARKQRTTDLFDVAPESDFED